jgi:hypothetical protein
VATHIVVPTNVLKINDVNRPLLKITVLLAAFAIGVFLGSVFKRAPNQRRQVEREIAATPTVSTNGSDGTYPAAGEVTPVSIADFIDQNPNADLTTLWKRLKLEPHDKNPREMDHCSNCKAQLFKYDLDGAPGDEVVLSLADPTVELFRYLVFKSLDSESARTWKFLGYVDAWGKYSPAQHLVLLSGGRAFLVVRGQTSSGSGVATYHEQIFQVTAQELRKLASYPITGYQSASGMKPPCSRSYSGRVVSCEISGGVARVVVSYSVDFFSDEDGPQNLLFSRQKRAVLIGARNGESVVVDRSRSEITQRELETVYNIDSMGESDFFEYNFEELRTMALYGNDVNKRWLGETLDAASTTALTRQLKKLLVETR